MSFQGVILTLNNLKKEKIIGDYAICRGYAISYYLEPAYTYDLDIVVLLNDEEEYHNLYAYLRKRGNKIENVYIWISDMPVQFLPSYIGGLYEGAIKEARKISVKGIPTKVVSIEYLVALLLKSYRPKDKIRIVELLEKADIDAINNIIKKYQDEEPILQKRLRAILEAV